MGKVGKKHWNGKTVREQLIGALLAGERDMAELADSLTLSFAQLATLAGKEEVIRTLEGIVRLSELQTRVLLSRGRTVAAKELAEMAAEESPSELARKVCVDLLKFELTQVETRGEKILQPPVPPGPSEDAILRALEELGGVSHEG